MPALDLTVAPFLAHSGAMVGARTRLRAMALASLLSLLSLLSRPLAGTAGAAPVVGEAAMLDETGALARALDETRHAPAAPLGFRRRLVDATEMRAAAAAVVAAGYRPAEVAVEQRMLQRLGLLAPGADYLALLTASVAARPAALYDPDARRLYVPDWIDLPTQRPSLAHALAHALQDQRFGLLRLLRLRPADAPGLDFDQRLARQALIEGDAAVLAMEATDARGLFPSSIELSRIEERMRASLASPGGTPFFLRQLQAFPYIEGFAFVAELRGTDSWSAVDALWKQPPESTAEILHPERLRAERLARREPPPVVVTTPLPGLGGAPARVDTLGEYFIRVWLQPAAAPVVAERAATGWRGDRIAIYDRPGTLGGFPDPPAKDSARPAELRPRDRPGTLGGFPDPPARDSARPAELRPRDRPGTLGGFPDPPAKGAPRIDAGAAALAWLTEWDSQADADDFLRVAGTRLDQLAREPAAPAGEADAGTAGSTAVPAAAEAAAAIPAADGEIVARQAGSGLVFAAARRADRVALLLGAPDRALPALAAMLDDWRPPAARGDRRPRGATRR